MTTFEIASLIIQGGSGLLVAAGLFYAAKQIRTTHDWNRRKAAQDATLMLTIGTNGMNLLQEHFSYMTRTDPIACSEFQPVFEKHPEVRITIHDLLNYYEAIARGVFQGIYDEQIIKPSKTTAAFRAYDKLTPYIRQRRLETSSPNLWNHFEALVSSWRRDATNLAKRPATDQVSYKGER